MAMAFKTNQITNRTGNTVAVDSLSGVLISTPISPRRSLESELVAEDFENLIRQASQVLEIPLELADSLIDQIKELVRDKIDRLDLPPSFDEALKRLLGERDPTPIPIPVELTGRRRQE